MEEKLEPCHKEEETKRTEVQHNVYRDTNF